MQRLRRGTEEGTGSSITLDSDNCISEIELRDRRRAAQSTRLQEMVDSEAEINVRYYTPLWGGTQHHAQSTPDGRHARVLISDYGLGGYWTRLFGRGPCWGRAPATLAAVISHELIGHTYHQIVARPGSGSGEPYAVAWENRHHRLSGEPIRCSH